MGLKQIWHVTCLFFPIVEPFCVGGGGRLVTNAVSTYIYKVCCAPDIFTGMRAHFLGKS